jgi:hypothetical protein
MVKNIAEDASIILSLTRSFVNVGMQLRTTPMISTYKHILIDKLDTGDRKAAGRDNILGSGSRI